MKLDCAEYSKYNINHFHCYTWYS